MLHFSSFTDMLLYGLMFRHAKIKEYVMAWIFAQKDLVRNPTLLGFLDTFIYVHECNHLNALPDDQTSGVRGSSALGGECDRSFLLKHVIEYMAKHGGTLVQMNSGKEDNENEANNNNNDDNNNHFHVLVDYMSDCCVAGTATENATTAVAASVLDTIDVDRFNQAMENICQAAWSVAGHNSRSEQQMIEYSVLHLLLQQGHLFGHLLTNWLTKRVQVGDKIACHLLVALPVTPVRKELREKWCDDASFEVPVGCSGIRGVLQKQRETIASIENKDMRFISTGLKDLETTSGATGHWDAASRKDYYSVPVESLNQLFEEIMQPCVGNGSSGSSGSSGNTTAIQMPRLVERIVCDTLIYNKYKTTARAALLHAQVGRSTYEIYMDEIYQQGQQFQQVILTDAATGHYWAQ